MKSNLFLALATALMATVSLQAGLPIIVASDSAADPAYAPQPDHDYGIDNGGLGYNTWTPLADTGGGGTYMEGPGVNGRQVDDTWSFGLYAAGGSYDISRPLVNPIAGVGEFDVNTRFDVADSPGASLVNIRAGNNLAAFGGGELLSFGIVNGNSLSYTDGSGFNLLPSGEARGARWGWNIDFNTIAGTYSLSVTNLGGGFAAFVSGNLEASGTSAGSFAVINSSTGNNQDVIFDLPTFSVPVPEPSSLTLLGGALLFGLRRIRRRR